MLKSKKIIFTPLYPINENFYPKPSIKNIPQWYKETNNYIGSNKFKIENGFGNSTIKKCIPVFDAITAGYTLFTHSDIYVSFSQNGSEFYCTTGSKDFSLIDSHPNNQANIHPLSNKMPYPKLMSPWAIKTPNGYSSLFVPPMHNPNNFFTIFPGIVDTDQYISPVNFPFVLDNPTFEGTIPAGTPICQIIPFKRDSFEMKIAEKNKDIENVDNFIKKYSIKFLNNYKSRFWQRKYFK